MKTLDVRDVSKTGCRDVTNLEVTVWAYYTRLRLRLRHVTAEHVRGGDIPTAPLYPLAGRYAVKCRGPLPDMATYTTLSPAILFIYIIYHQLVSGYRYE
jgi:hypothetical protein